jgi:hypothetical protein
MSQLDPVELLHVVEDIYNSRLIGGKQATIVGSVHLKLTTLAITIAAAITLALYDWLLTFSDGQFFSFICYFPEKRKG